MSVSLPSQLGASAWHAVSPLNARFSLCTRSEESRALAAESDVYVVWGHRDGAAGKPLPGLTLCG